MSFPDFDERVAAMKAAGVAEWEWHDEASKGRIRLRDDAKDAPRPLSEAEQKAKDVQDQKNEELRAEAEEDRRKRTALGASNRFGHLIPVRPPRRTS